MIHAFLEKKGNATYICLEISGMNPIMYEVIPTDKLYEMIHASIPIALDQVCVEGFSMIEYRNKYGINKQDIIEIKIDFITDSIFSGKTVWLLIFLDVKWLLLIL